MSDRATKAAGEIKRIAEHRFRADRDGRRIQFRCRCPSYATRTIGVGIEVRCVDSRGKEGCGFAVWMPIAQLELALRGAA